MDPVEEVYQNDSTESKILSKTAELNMLLVDAVISKDQKSFEIHSKKLVDHIKEEEKPEMAEE